LFPVILISGLYWMPESPRWLTLNDRSDEALKILKRLRQSPDDPDHAVANAEMFQIGKQMELEKTLDASWLHIFRNKSYLRRFGYAIATTGILQCCGQQVITSTLFNPEMLPQSTSC
jgi:hypothetical protein